MKDESGYGIIELFVGVILFVILIVVLFKVLEHL